MTIVQNPRPPLLSSNIIHHRHLTPSIAITAQHPLPPPSTLHRRCHSPFIAASTKHPPSSPPPPPNTLVIFL
ncbi:hypothetical protein SESBI_40467 [Sesbania bispinosa]|nr:hypothetical protein SESBI_40467 [Sesbania bispinosa]